MTWARTFPAVVGAAWLLAASCGGRSLGGLRSDAAVEASGAAGQGAAGMTGAAGTIGAGSGAAGTGAAGTRAAGTGAAGSGAAGAGAAGAGAAGSGLAGQGGAGGAACGPCPPAACNPGFTPVIDPAVSCCAICRRIDCAKVDCAPPTCPAGMHLELLDGQCCPTCQPGTVSSTCQKGLAYYTQLRAQLVEKYGSQGCNVDADCTLVFENNACAATCGTAYPVSSASSAQSNLDSAAKENCATCPAPPVPPCAKLSAFCSNGRCTSGAAPPPRPDAGTSRCQADPKQTCMLGLKSGQVVRCVAPYTQPDGCNILSIGDATDFYCCP